MEYKNRVVRLVASLVLTTGQLLAQEAIKCGGQLNQQTGVIKSPNYPGSYPNYQQCLWNIRAKEQEIVDLQFSNLDLEGTVSEVQWIQETCPDFVKVYDGDSQNSPLIATLCRTKNKTELAQISIRSTENKMLVLFSSDYDGQRSGFVATYWTHVCPTFTYGSETCNKSCACVQENTRFCNNTNGNCICANGWRSEDCSQDVDECLDPRTEPCPFNYRQCENTKGGHKCVCKDGLIEGDFGDCVVNIDSTCGENTCSHLCVNTAIQNQEAEEHCYCPVNTKLVENSCQACSNVNFGNDCQLGCSCVPANTQSCDVTTGGCICLPGWTSPNCSRDINECTELRGSPCPSQSEQCVNTEGGYECNCRSGLPKSPSGSCEGCSYTLTDLSGVIQSPNYPEEPYDNVRCNWTITAPNRDAKILLSLTQINLGTYDEYRVFCYYDSLEIYDGNSSDTPLLGRFCGYYSNNISVQSSSNMMYLIFRTNTVHWTRIFKGTYSVREYQTFKANFTSPSGVVTSPGYPDSYPYSVFSTWTIKVLAGNVVTFSFADYQLGKCGQDYIEVYDGCHFGAKRIARFCDNNQPNKISSTGECMHIVHSSDSTTSERGFNGSYVTDACRCKWSQTESCNSPTGPCVCKRGFSGAECYQDIDECLDNLDNSCPPHSQCVNSYGSFECYCWNGTRVTSNDVCNDWQTVLSNQSGEIQSQNYPRFYPPYMNYTWTIKGKPNTVVSLRFAEFDLEGVNKCYKDSVAVYDDLKSNLRLIGLYCGNNMPSLLRSTASDMLIVFKTDGYNWIRNYNGFKCSYHTHVCPVFMYGEESCSNHCPCAYDKTHICDNTNGVCFCKPGWVGRGCSQDLNECLETDVCPPNSECINQLGSYTCQCLSGYVMNSTTHYCYESSSCSEEMKHTCSHLCDVDPVTNNDTCFCPDGLVLLSDQVTCDVPLYHFGPEAVDLEVHDIDNYDFPQPGDVVQISSLLPVGSSLTSTLGVFRNGVITCKTGPDIITRHPDLTKAQKNQLCLIAPLWTAGSSYLAGDVYYHVYETCGPSVFEEPDFNDGPSPRKQEVVNRAVKDVKQYYGLSSFDVSTVVVATWKDVQPSGCPDSFRNMFQLVLVSGYIPNTAKTYLEAEERTYAVVLYKDGEGICKPGQPIEVGTCTDSGVTSFLTDRNSTKLGQIIGNTDLLSNQYFKTEISELYKCPCSLDKLGLQWQFVKEEGNTKCFSISFIAKNRLLRNNQRNRLCCYLWTPPRSDSWEDWQESWLAGTFIPSGQILISDPWPFGNARSYQDALENMESKSWCCENSPYIFCNRFHKVFGDLECTNHPTFVPASALGDPDIQTLDGLSYLMNGQGEYIMLDAPSEDFTLQARTQRVEINGTLSNGTVFTAFAGQQGVDTRFQVQLSAANTTMVIFINGMDFTKRFYSDSSFIKTTQSLSVMRRNENKRIIVVATFSCGVSLKVHVDIRSLGIDLEIDSSLRNKTRGLLGNFNGIKTDDFQLPNGTILPANITERQILQLFAKSYLVTNQTSVFMYEKGESTENYQHPEFEPTYQDEAKPEVISKAHAVCGDDNKACINDYLATGNEEFARSTKEGTEMNELKVQRLKNNPPKVRPATFLTKGFWLVHEGIENVATLAAEDDDKDDVDCELAENTDGVSLNREGIIKYTPDRHNPINLRVRARDSKGAYSSVMELPIKVCPHCNKHGTCNIKDTQAQFLAGRFQILKCTCFPSYDGENCESEFDACKLSPCSVGQTCTDLTTVEQGNNSVGYRCGPCPAGTKDVNGSCEDVNECDDSETCDQDCQDTYRSYRCSCRPGFRLDPTNKRSCNDINECSEGTSSCEQVCENTVGSYTCACIHGYTLSSDGRTCVTDSNMACQHCDQICTNNNNENICGCKLGYKVNESDPKKCSDIDECNNGGRSPCSQNCVNTPGKFQCACYTGFRLDVDGVSCLECDSSYFGDGCFSTCDCRGRGTCDKVRGCVCDKGWSGANCDKDINECASPNACAAGLICHNEIGSFSCVCPDGYRKKNEQCRDIDECSEHTNRCDLDVEDCHNTVGSYNCLCKEGYTRNLDTGICEDINECESHMDGCEHSCENGPGSYRCVCHQGYRLTDDRRKCVKYTDVCSLACNYGCSFDDSGTPACFCPRGFRKTGTDSCEDVEECLSEGDNLCEHRDRCTNTQRGYTCSCDPGYRLENDGKTCTACSGGTWGVECANSCACSVGTISCDSVTGCICKPGYTGTHCADVIDRCASREVTCLSTEECVFSGGDSVCQCRSGFIWSNGQCQDEDECLNSQRHNCQHVCTNTVGSYTCSCHPGYHLNSTTNTCKDINECESAELHNCVQVCLNKEGSFSCLCHAGYHYDTSTNSCHDEDECSDKLKNNCDQICTNTVGSYSCSCLHGYQYDSADQKCHDVDECQDVALHHCDQVCTNTGGGFHCSCFTGYLYNSTTNTCYDEDECSDKLKNNCDQICTNTVGSYSCSCIHGYHYDSTVQKCHDVDECQDVALHHCDQVCTNTGGGFHCSCFTGYLYNSTTNTCYDIDECQNGNPCANFTKCKNLNGSFECLCWNGLRVGTDGTCKDCNRTLTGRTGSFMSSNHPGLYPSNSYCSWTIQIPESDAIIVLSFHSYDLEGCFYDYIRIYNGDSPRGFPRIICNNNWQTSVISKGNSLHILFTSDFDNNKSGFLATYTSVLQCKRKTCSHTCSVVSSNPRTEQCQCPDWMKLDLTNDSRCVTAHDCDTVITEPTGSLVSPNYPEKYPANSICHWTLKGGPNSKIIISFADFALETSFYCRDDHVRIYDGSSESAAMLGNFCGKNLPANITSTGNIAFVSFKSDILFSYRGFRITYNIHAKTKSQISTGTMGMDSMLATE